MIKKIKLGTLLGLMCILTVGCDAKTADYTTEWHMVNVNYGGLQGDANLLLNGGVVTMIDGGRYEEARVAVLPYLKNLGIKKVDHFFISHPHQDHYEGMEAILVGGIAVDNVYYNMPAEDASDCCYSREHFEKYLQAAEDRGAKLHDIGEGFSLDFPNHTKLDVLYAHKKSSLNDQKLDINDLSLIMQWKTQHHTVLFTGDLNRKVGSYLSDDERMISDFLKVPHHGASSLAPDRFFDKVAAKFGMIPGPREVWLGKRGKQARSWFQSRGIAHCVNGVNGTISIQFGESVVITADNDSQYCQSGTMQL